MANSYRIVALLGEGGMGAVYRAEHTLVGRKAAVKVLLPEWSQRADMVERFFREARAATAVEHPGIAAVFDFGYLEDGCAFLIMELLGGETLATRLGREQRLPVGRAVAVVRQLAGALAAVHAHGIVHRDLKPENVFLVPDPDVAGGERAKILDFGIAKLVEPAGPSAGGGLRGPADGKTREGTVLGTPAYMAPEQCRGSGTVDHRADVYALGCVLFHMLAGRPPFVLDGIGELLAAHQHVAPPVVSTLVPEVPAWLADVVAAMLIKDPDARLQDMAAVVAALDGGGPIEVPARGAGPHAATVAAPGPSTLTAAGAGERMTPTRVTPRRWWPVVAIAAIVAVGAGGFGVWRATVAHRAGGAAVGSDAAPIAVVTIDGGAAIDAAAVAPVRPPPCRELAACEARCGLTDPDACARAATEYLVGRGVGQDEARAAALFVKAAQGHQQRCRDGDLAACRTLGLAYKRGDRGVVYDPTKGDKLLGEARTGYRMRCDGGDGEACAVLGDMLDDAEGGAADRGAAVERWTRACDADVVVACEMLGLHFHGTPDPADDVRALAALRQAVALRRAGCDRPDAAECARLAGLLRAGHGATRDLDRARTLFEQVCEQAPALGCGPLGEMVLEGAGGGRDATRAATLLGAACDAGAEDACATLAARFLDGKLRGGRAAATTVLAAACDRGALTSCVVLGELRDKAGDRAGAVTAYRRACTGDLGPGCTHLGMAFRDGHGVAKDRGRAGAHFAEACTEGDPDGCRAAAEMYEKGHSDFPRDLARAAYFEEAGCSLEDVAACARLATRLERGTGVAADPARAAAVRQRACQLGDARACRT